MGRLERKLDVGLIAKLERGWKPSDAMKPLKRQKEPRHASTYRGARQNDKWGRK